MSRVARRCGEESKEATTRGEEEKGGGDEWSLPCDLIGKVGMYNLTDLVSR